MKNSMKRTKSVTNFNKRKNNAAFFTVTALLAIAVFVFTVYNAEMRYKKRNVENNLQMQFFHSGEDYFTLLICGGGSAVICPSDVSGAEEVADSLEKRLIDKIGLLVMTAGPERDNANQTLGEYSASSELLFPSDNAESFTVGDARCEIRFSDGAYYLNIRHGDCEISLCGGDADPKTYAEHAANADMIIVPENFRESEDMKNLISGGKAVKAVVCDSGKDPAPEDFLWLLRNSGITFMRTAYGNICANCDGTNITLLPDRAQLQ